MELIHGADVTDTTAKLTPNGGDQDDRASFHVTFDPVTDSIPLVVIESVAAIQNEDPEELDPIHHAVDADSLESLFKPDHEAHSGVETVQFVYEGMHVTIEREGDLWLRWR